MADTTPGADGLAAGQIRWHSSGEDEGPDVGIEIGLPDGSTLWVGDITKRSHEEAAGHEIGDDGGWWLIHYRDQKPSYVVGKALSTWQDFGGVDALAAALYKPTVSTDVQPVSECPSCSGLNTSCPDGCGRDPVTGELNGSRLTPETIVEKSYKEWLADIFAPVDRERRKLCSEASGAGGDPPCWRVLPEAYRTEECSAGCGARAILTALSALSNEEGKG